MVKRLRVRVAETHPPPLSRIMLARGRRFAFSAYRNVLIGNDRRFQPWPFNCSLANFLRLAHIDVRGAAGFG
jgi:hypothetical protein